MCSYNLHWYFSVHASDQRNRVLWTQQYRFMHLFLFIGGLFGASFFGLFLLDFWPWIGLAGLLSFLYTAPKIPFPLFQRMKKIAYGKTIYLAAVWLYVTSILPIVVSSISWSSDFIWFILSRFFLMYANCILFDLRDREADIKDGIRSMVTSINQMGIRILFVCSIFLFILFSFMAKNGQNQWYEIAVLLFPGILLAVLYGYFKRHQSDYTYYFLLDGLLILSPVMLLVLRFL
jgi:4-hydroxybenzoate polyprenyltransferase